MQRPELDMVISAMVIRGPQMLFPVWALEMRFYRGERQQADGWERMEGVPRSQSRAPHREAVGEAPALWSGKTGTQDLSTASPTQTSANGFHNGSIL